MTVSIKTVFRRVWVSLGLCFTIWLVFSYQANQLDDAIFSSTSTVTVHQTDDYVSFMPARSNPPTVLFLPGALVDPNAYAPMGRQIAEAGYGFYLLKMPWRMASYGYRKIDRIFSLPDSSRKYILAGHSLGGRMAAQYVHEKPGAMAGLLLLGTSHPRDIDLSSLSIPVLKLYASNDGLASPQEVMQNRDKLPPSAQFGLIRGGNHAQFGSYGSQLGDETATISAAEQQQQVVRSITRFLAQF